MTMAEPSLSTYVDRIITEHFTPTYSSVPGATDSVIERLKRGEVPTLTCPRCNGKRNLNVENPRLRRSCTRCNGKGSILVTQNHQKPDGFNTCVHFECKGAGCAGCRWRGYSYAIDAAPMSSGAYGCEPTDLRFDVVMVVSRWLRGLDGRTRAAVGAWYNPKAVQWREELEADREGRTKYTHETRPALDLAPLLPVTRYGRAAYSSRDLPWGEDLAEASIAEALMLKDQISAAVADLRAILRVKYDRD